MIKEIKFTDKAIKQINHLLTQKNSGTFFRIAILGGGCSGFKYDFSYEKKPENEDLILDKVLIDKASAEMLKGSEVDYVSELIGDSFKISNPQTKSSCGCGVSFAI
jgi:iron-sulfur cluster assembly accessory protein